MKVRFTMPVRGSLRLQHAGEIVFPDMVFRFIGNPASGFVDQLELEMLNVQRENWPTLVHVEQDPDVIIPRFPFDINPNALQLSFYVPQIINLESLLSIFGLEEIDIASTKHEWISEPDDEAIGMFQEFAPGERKPEAFSEPVSDAMLARAIVSSSSLTSDTVGLAHFRAGLSMFSATRYIDSIRYLYLSLEYLYAQGHHKKKQTLNVFRKTPSLISSIEQTISNAPSAKSALSQLCSKYPELKNIVTADVFLEWMYDLRGNIQHGNPKSPKNWHPSRQHDFRQECVLILNVVHDVCWDIAIKRLKAA